MAVIYNVISGLFSAPVGVVADRIDRDNVLISTGLLLNALAIFIFALPFLFERFALYLIVAGVASLGFGQSFYHPPVGASVLSGVYRKGGGAPRAMGINGSFGSLGGRAITPPLLIVSLIALLRPSHSLFILAGYTAVGGGVAVLLGLRRVRRSAPSANRGGRGRGCRWAGTGHLSYSSPRWFSLGPCSSLDQQRSCRLPGSYLREQGPYGGGPPNHLNGHSGYGPAVLWPCGD